MTRGRPLGTKNLPGHRAGGKRKSISSTCMKGQKTLTTFLTATSSSVASGPAASGISVSGSSSVACESGSFVPVPSAPFCNSVSGSSSLVVDESSSATDSPFASNPPATSSSSGQSASTPPLSPENINYIDSILEARLSILKEKGYSDYLKDSLWVPEPDPTLSLLKMAAPEPSLFYSKKLFVWFPDLLCPNRLACPDCQGKLLVHEWKRPRRVVGLCVNYFVVTKRYKCKNCNRSFSGYSRKLMKSLPNYISSLFPAILSKRSGLDLQVFHVMRTAFSDGMGPTEFSRLLEELHYKEYHRQLSNYMAICLERKAGVLGASLSFQPFSKFDDKFGYGGFTPCANYLKDVYVTKLEEWMPTFNKELSKRSGRVLSHDHSFKIPKRLATMNGSRVFDALYTVTNENSEIRAQFFTFGKAHSHLQNGLKLLQKSLAERGYQQPQCIFTDNVDADRTMLENTFPSLLESVVETKQRKFPIQVLPESCKVTIIESVAAANDILQHLLSQSVLGFDAEWDFNPVTKHRGRVALVQISTQNHCYLFHLTKIRQLPTNLITLINDSGVKKVGRNIRNDIRWLEESHNVALQAKSLVDLGSLCKALGVIEDGRSSLAAICQRVLGSELQKDPSVRISKWSGKLSKDQVNYAALDAYVSLHIFNRVIGIFGEPGKGKVAQSEAINGVQVAVQVGKKKILIGKITLPEGVVRKGRVCVKVDSVQLPSFIVRTIEGEDISARNSINRVVTVNLSWCYHASSTFTPQEIAQMLSSYYPQSEELVSPEVEDQVDVNKVYSRVLQDAWHLMHRIDVHVSVKHGWHREFIRSFRDALFILDKADKMEVETVLRAKGKTFEETYFRKPHWIHERVRRTIPSPHILHNRVKCVFEEFQNQIDERTKKPLFNEAAREEARKILATIKSGVVSDPPNMSFYFVKGIDKSGLTLYRCCRGTSVTEGGVHSKLMDNCSSHNASPEYSIKVMADQAYRHNKDILDNNEEVTFRHYDPWTINELQDMSRRLFPSNEEFWLFPDWLNTDNLQDTGECFGIVPIPDDILNEFGMQKFEEIDSEDENDGEEEVYRYPTPREESLRFLAKSMNSKFAILPISTDEEVVLFNTLLLDELKSSSEIDFKKLTTLFNEKADGINYFYKLPDHISGFKSKRYDRIQNMKLSMVAKKREVRGKVKMVINEDNALPQPKPLERERITQLPNSTLSNNINRASNVPLVNQTSEKSIDFKGKKPVIRMNMEQGSSNSQAIPGTFNPYIPYNQFNMFNGYIPTFGAFPPVYPPFVATHFPTVHAIPASQFLQPVQTFPATQATQNSASNSQRLVSSSTNVFTNSTKSFKEIKIHGAKRASKQCVVCFEPNCPGGNCPSNCKKRKDK